MPTFIRLLALACLVLPLAACSEKEDAGDGELPEAEGGHAHTSPRGGQLVELGDHIAQVDFVLDPETGTLHAYVMDAHATKAVRITMPRIDLAVTLGGEEVPLVLEAQADALSGETVGDTSHFLVQSDRLKGAERFEARIGRIAVYDIDFEDVAFTYEPHPVRD